MRFESVFTLCILLLLVQVFAVAGLRGESRTDADHQWEILFDGTSVDAWRGYQREDFPHGGWVIEEGALKTIPREAGGDVVDLITREKYGSFELVFEWKVTPGGNSGIFFHVTEDYARSWHSGPELQILDDAGHRDGGRGTTSAGSLYDLIAPSEDKVLRPVGEFNEARLVVRGDDVEHWLNGVKVVEFTLGSQELNELIAASKFSDLPGFAKAGEGHVALQHHGEEVWFRNVKIRRLPSP